MPTDTDTTRQFLVAARLFGALTAVFFAVGAIAVVAALGSAGPPATASPAASAATAPHPAAVATTAPPATAPPATLPADPSAPVVVEVGLEEFAFVPRAITVPAGRPVVLRVTNTGAVDHELVVGNAHVQDEAEEAMTSASGHGSHGGGHHGDVPSIYLRPGESGELTATFDEPGRLLLGCHVAGHWAAGMQGSLTVAA